MKELKFIHITKNAGTSISNLGAQVGLEWGSFHKEYGWWHSKFSAKSFIFKAQYDWFMVVRNPYTRMISEFHCKWGGVGNKASKYNTSEFNDLLCNFIMMYAPKAKGGHYTPQYDYINGVRRKVHKIHVLRFENLKEEFENLMELYGHDLKLNLHTVKSKKKFGVGQLEPQTIRLIKNVYEKDFKHFNYSTEISYYQNVKYKYKVVSLWPYKMERMKDIKKI